MKYYHQSKGNKLQLPVSYGTNDDADVQANSRYHANRYLIEDKDNELKQTNNIQ